MVCISTDSHKMIRIPLKKNNLSKPWLKDPKEPSCAELVAELQMIQAWLPALAGWDEDFDVDLTEGLGGVHGTETQTDFFGGIAKEEEKKEKERI